MDPEPLGFSLERAQHLKGFSFLEYFTSSAPDPSTTSSSSIWITALSGSVNTLLEWGLVWAVGVPLVLLAGAARICYVVHSVNQILVGWRLGIAIAVLAVAAERPLADAASRLGLVFALWHAVAMWSIHQKSPPAEWAERFAELLVELDEQDEPYSLVAPAPIAKVDLDF